MLSVFTYWKVYEQLNVRYWQGHYSSGVILFICSQWIFIRETGSRNVRSPWNSLLSSSTFGNCALIVSLWFVWRYWSLSIWNFKQWSERLVNHDSSEHVNRDRNRTSKAFLSSINFRSNRYSLLLRPISLCSDIYARFDWKGRLSAFIVYIVDL